MDKSTVRWAVNGAEERRGKERRRAERAAEQRRKHREYRREWAARKAKQ